MRVAFFYSAFNYTPSDPLPQSCRRSILVDHSNQVARRLAVSTFTTRSSACGWIPADSSKTFERLSMSSNDKLVTSLAMLPPDCDVCLSSLVARYHCVCVHIRPRESSVVSRTNATNGSVPMFFRASHMITSQPSSIDLAGYLLPRYQVPPPPHFEAYELCQDYKDRWRGDNSAASFQKRLLDF